MNMQTAQPGGFCRNESEGGCKAVNYPSLYFLVRLAGDSPRTVFLDIRQASPINGTIG